MVRAADPGGRIPSYTYMPIREVGRTEVAYRLRVGSEGQLPVTSLSVRWHTKPTAITKRIARQNPKAVIIGVECHRDVEMKVEKKES